MSKDPEAKKMIRLMLLKTLFVVVVMGGAAAFFLIAGPEALIGDANTPQQAVQKTGTATSASKKSRPVPAGEYAKIGGEFDEMFTDMDAGLDVPDFRFAREDGSFMQLSDLRGKVVLLNVWATWCAPCVVEMPTLDALQGQYGGDDFEVVALSFDRDGITAVVEFYEETAIDHLKVYADTVHDAQNKLTWGGLPMTILIDRDGREIGRLPGPADWFSEDAQSLIKDAIAGEAG